MFINAERYNSELEVKSLVLVAIRYGCKHKDINFYQYHHIDNYASRCPYKGKKVNHYGVQLPMDRFYGLDMHSF